MGCLIISLGPSVTSFWESDRLHYCADANNPKSSSLWLTSFILDQGNKFLMSCVYLHLSPSFLSLCRFLQLRASSLCRHDITPTRHAQSFAYAWKVSGSRETQLLTHTVLLARGIIWEVQGLVKSSTRTDLRLSICTLRLRVAGLLPAPAAKNPQLE